MLCGWPLECAQRKKELGSVPTTPDPNTSEKVSRYKWEAYRDTNWVVYIVLSAKRRAYFSQNIAIEMGGVSRYFSKVSGSGVDLTLLKNSAPVQSGCWAPSAVTPSQRQAEGTPREPERQMHTAE